MSVINPPVELENPENQFRVKYIQNETLDPDFSYPTVSISALRPLQNNVYI